MVVSAVFAAVLVALPWGVVGRGDLRWLLGRLRRGTWSGGRLRAGAVWLVGGA